MKQHSLTIFTPTYNRASLLGELYASLKAQTNRDFCWLIVDDGSTDETEQTVQTFMTEGTIDIIYHKQPNSGKHVAHNRGVQMATTELFVCVDSDDTLCPTAVARTLAFWQNWRGQADIAGIVSPRDMAGHAYMVNPPKADRLMALYHHGCLVGDTMLVFRREVLAQYPFPVIEGENFLSECVAYDQIDRFYRLAVQNEFLYRSEYRADGLTQNIRRNHWKNPRGVLLMYHTIAAYRQGVLTAAKAQGAYLAWQRVTGATLPGKAAPVAWYVRLAGCLLRRHYEAIFLKEREQFCP